MALAVACLNFILLFTIIFIINALFCAFIYVTGRYIYGRLYPEPRWTANEDEGVTKSHKGFIDRPTRHDGLFDRGQHTLQNQRQHFSDTQNVERSFIEISDDSDSDLDVPFLGSGGTLLNTQNISAQHGISKTPPDPPTDRNAQAVKPWDPGFQEVIAPLILGSRPSMRPPARSSQPLMKPREGSEQHQRVPASLAHGSQPLITPPDRALLPTTLARRPAYRRRPIESLDDAPLDHHDEDDDDDDHDDHDYIDDSETDSSDSIWEPRSSKKRKSPLKKTLLTCLPGPSAPEPKLLIARRDGPSTSENLNSAVTSDSHVHPTQTSQRRSPVPAAVDKAQECKAYSVLTITMRYSKIRNKDVHVRYFTSSSASHIHSPPSKTPCWTFEPEDLYLHWQGPFNVKVWVWERNGRRETA